MLCIRWTCTAECVHISVYHCISPIDLRSFSEKQGHCPSTFHLTSKQWTYKLCLHFFRFLYLFICCCPWGGPLLLLVIACTLSKLVKIVDLCALCTVSCSPVPSLAHAHNHLWKRTRAFIYFILNCHWRKSPRINNEQPNECINIGERILAGWRPFIFFFFFPQFILTKQYKYA